LPVGTATTTAPPARPRTSHTAPATHAQTPTGVNEGAGTVLTGRLSGPSTILLIGVLLATALGVAVVVRLGGRRGSHRG
jgi:hypothetical protein